MSSYYYAYHFAGWGQLTIVQEGNFITGVSPSCAYCRGEKRQTELIQNAKSQLEEYFAGRRKEFNLPIEACGTEFQKRVWQELEKIAYGTTTTYGEIAKRIGNPNASRAVGGACNKNPICIIVPCHRVIGSNGNLTGYAFGIEFKRRLLSLEGIKF